MLKVYKVTADEKTITLDELPTGDYDLIAPDQKAPYYNLEYEIQEYLDEKGEEIEEIKEKNERVIIITSKQ